MTSPRERPPYSRHAKGREGEREISLGLGNVANKVKANISPKGGRGAEILGSGIFPS